MEIAKILEEEKNTSEEKVKILEEEKNKSEVKMNILEAENKSDEKVKVSRNDSALHIHEDSTKLCHSSLFWWVDGG